MPDFNFNTKNVNFDNGFFLIAGNEHVDLNSLSFDGCNEDGSGSIEWVMKVLGESVIQSVSNVEGDFKLNFSNTDTNKKRDHVRERLERDVAIAIKALIKHNKGE